MAVLIGVGGEERVQGGGDGPGLGAAVAMLGKDGDYFTPGVKGVIRFNQIDRSRLGYSFKLMRHKLLYCSSKHTLCGTIQIYSRFFIRCIVEGTLDGLEPGEHGLAVHETGDVSRGCHSLGDHFNPR